jgi:hypothetical protein
VLRPYGESTSQGRSSCRNRTIGVLNHAFSSLFCGGGKRGTMEQFRAWMRRLSAYGIAKRYILGTAIVGIVTVVQWIATPLPGGYVFIL